MGLLRFFWYLIIGFFLSVIQVGVLSALPFPFSDISLLAIALAVAISFRFDPRFFWVLSGGALGSDWYSASFLGLTTVALVITTLVVMRLTTDIVSHRSLVGCLVIGAACGGVWSVSFQLLTALHAWFVISAPAVWSLGDVGRTIATHLIGTALINGLFYELLPRWWHDRSPIVVAGRGI